MPDGKDPLDIAVARLCNVRGIRIERLDEMCHQDGDLIHRYAMFSKTVACRLLRMHKPEHPRDVDASYVQVRVGGGWLELDTWLDARI